MKQKVAWLAIAALTVGMALSCGPGNGGGPNGFLQGPYAGSSFIMISGGGSAEIQTDGSPFIYDIPITVTDTDTGYPVPNIQVKATVYLQSTTTSDYSWLFLNNDFRLSGGGNSITGTLKTLTTGSDFHGVVDFRLEIPAEFDGKVKVVFETSNNQVDFTITIKFSSGTTCTDGTDNNNNGFTDNSDPACLDGYSVEPIGGATLTATQNPTGTIAQGGTVRINAAGGTPPYAFTSNNPAIANIDVATGVVTAGAIVGAAMITVTDAALITATVNVAVGNPATKVSPTIATLNVSGAPNPRTIQVEAQDAFSNTLVGVTWSSSNGACAAVNPTTGMVTVDAAAANGCTTDVIATPPGGVPATCVVTANNP